MTSVTFNIRGMHCDGCAARIKRVLEGKTGVRAAAVTFATGQVLVSYDEPKITMDQLRRAIERAGYATSLAG